MPALTIARATPADLPDLLPLFAGYRSFYGRGNDAVQEEAFLRERMQRGESAVLLARRESRAAGFVQLYPLFSSVSMARKWLLNDLFVAPASRGTGTATALLDAACAFGRDTGAIGLVLETAVDNATARRLYERLGWVRDEHFLVYAIDPRNQS